MKNPEKFLTVTTALRKMLTKVLWRKQKDSKQRKPYDNVKLSTKYKCVHKYRNL